MGFPYQIEYKPNASGFLNAWKTYPEHTLMYMASPEEVLAWEHCQELEKQLNPEAFSALQAENTELKQTIEHLKKQHEEEVTQHLLDYEKIHAEKASLEKTLDELTKPNQVASESAIDGEESDGN
jgi:cell division protein FtsB